MRKLEEDTVFDGTPIKGRLEESKVFDSRLVQATHEIAASAQRYKKRRVWTSSRNASSGHTDENG